MGFDNDPIWYERRRGDRGGWGPFRDDIRLERCPRCEVPPGAQCIGREPGRSHDERLQVCNGHSPAEALAISARHRSRSKPGGGKRRTSDMSSINYRARPGDRFGRSEKSEAEKAAVRIAGCPRRIHGKPKGVPCPGGGACSVRQGIAAQRIRDGEAGAFR